jgi:hypothetical protein
LFFIVALPYCIPVSVLTLPIKLVCMFVCYLMKDKAFHNSARYLVNLVLWPILMIIYAVIAYSFLPWQWVQPVTIVLMPAPIVAHETWRVLRVLISDVKLLFFAELRDKYAKIRNIMFNM